MPPTVAGSEEHARVDEKPVLHTLDCGYENSLEHWLEVYWLVEDEYEFAKDADREVPQNH
jgi:hypothetical protein